MTHAGRVSVEVGEFGGSVDVYYVYTLDQWEEGTSIDIDWGQTEIRDENDNNVFHLMSRDQLDKIKYTIEKESLKV